MAQGGPIPGPAVRNTNPDPDDFGLVVRVVGSGGVGVLVAQGTVPWVVSDPSVEAALNVNLSTRASEATLAALNAMVAAGLDVPLSTRASEATLVTRLADATFTARINTLGQKTMAASTPVVLASDQSSVPVNDGGGSLTVDTPQLPAALVGARLDVNNGAWLGSTAPTVGQKTMASSIPVTMASDQPAVQTGTQGPLEQETFGQLVTSSRATQVSADWINTIANNSVTSTVTNGGTATQANGSVTIATGANVNGTAKLQTIGLTSYQPGREIYVLFTAAFTTPTSANSNQRSGLYDTNDGFFVGFSGLTFGSTSRSLGVDTFTARGSWNGDLLTGAAGSKFTRGGVPEAIDFTKRNIYRIRFGWLGDAPIRYEVLSPDGQWVLFNTIREPNLVTTPSIANPNLPITMEVVKAAADATSLSISSSSWDAGVVSNVVGKQNSNIDGGNSSATPLGVGGVFTGIGIDVSGFSAISVYVFADQQGTLSVQFSTNNSNWEVFQTVTVNASNPRHFFYAPQARFFRVVYTNGATPQGAFRLQTIERPAATIDDLQYNTSGGLIVDASSSTFAQLPAALVGGRLDENLGAWLGSTAPTVGQKTMANSVPMVIASDQSAVPVSGTVTVTDPAEGNTGAAVPAKAIQSGGSDGTNLQALRMFDADSGAGTQFVQGVQLRKAAAGGSVEAGTSTDPLRIDPTGTTAQPVTDNGGSLTVDTPQLPAALVGGRLDANVGAWLGNTTPTVGQKTMASSIPVAIASDQSAVTITDPAEATPNTAVPGKAIQVGGSDGTNLQTFRSFDVDTGAGTQFVQGISLRKAAAGGSVEAGTSTDPLRIDPTGTTAQPVNDNGGSLTIDTGQLPAALVGGRLDENVGAWLGSTAPTVGQKTMANSLPVVIASDQSAVAVSGTITITDPAEGNTGAAVPAKAIQSGGSDGANLQALRMFDADTGAGTQFVQGVQLRKSAAGGSVEAGTSTDPLRVDPTGTTAQPVTDNGGSLTIDTGQLPAALVGGRLDENVGAWLGSTAPTVGQKTMANSIPVAIASDQSAVSVTDARLPAALVGGRLDTNIGAWLGSTAPTVGQKTMANSVPTVLASDQSAIPVTDNGGSLTIDTPQLPAALVGGRLDVNNGTWLGSTAPTVGQKTMANSIPVTMASDQTAIQVSGTEGPVEQDTYGGLVSAPRVSQLAADFSQSLSNNPVTSTVTNGGTVAQANGSLTISTGANVSGTAKLNTNGSTVYQPGHEIYVQFTAAFTTPTSANSNQRAGHYDANNGFFVGFAGLTFGSSVRFATADTFTARGSWNGDLLTGAAGSKFTRGGTPEAIDLTKRNVYRIRYGWLGDSPIRYEVLSPDGQWVLFNTIRQPNLATTPSTQNPNLPITMEAVKAAADATVLSITSSSWDAGIVSANPPGTLANGAETAVSNAAVAILGANPTRKAAMIQNTGSANIRVGITGVTATTGYQLTPGSTIVFQMPFCPLQQLFAIREGGTDSTAFAQEIT